jgi:glycosyltransferase involved in cell wall biosynthesis
MNILVGVGGRFHADQMTKALLTQHEVKLHTTYPASRFRELPPSRITSYLGPEIAYRGLKYLGAEILGEHAKMLSFGRAMATYLESGGEADALIAWSSFALESFRVFRDGPKILVRDSAHILFQSNILNVEYDRLGLTYPNKHIGITRELQEYAIADHIFLLSEFARNTFVRAGVPKHKLKVIRLGVDTKMFHPRAVYAPTLPLKVVYFGSLSIQKGIPYLIEAFKQISPQVAKLILVGDLSSEIRPLLAGRNIEVRPAMPHARLSEFIREQDVFIFPTVHDGFGQTLIQAMASGLVPITTQNCGAADLITQGKNGLVVPAQSARRLTEAVEILAGRLEELPEMSREALKVRENFGWSQYAAQVREAVLGFV